MKIARVCFPLFIGLAGFGLFSCAGPAKGLMTQYDPAKPLDQAQLERYCDYEDTAACFLAGKPRDGSLSRLPVIQGLAPAGKIVFSVLLKTGESAQWFLLERNPLRLQPIALSKIHARPPSSFRLERYELGGLKAGETYELIAVDGNGMLLDHRKITSFQPERKSLRFALVSCADDSLTAEQGSQWELLAAQEPHLVFAIGDNVYADYRKGQKLGPSVDPATLWERYAETRQTLAIFRNPVLVPFFAVWDDHDFGMNDGDETYPYVEASRKIMEAFFPSIADSKTIVEGPGVSRALMAAGQSFILFDDRSFRSPNGLPPVCRRSPSSLCKGKAISTEDSTHFGRVQEDWALLLMEKSGGPVWLMSGDQWFGGYHPFESYEGNHPESFRRFLSKLERSLKKAAASRKKPAVVFASGDRHLSEIIKVKPFGGYETYEFTSSGIHAFMFPNAWKDYPNRRQLVGSSGIMNFSIFDTAVAKDGGLEISVKALGLGDQELYRKSLRLRPVTR